MNSGAIKIFFLQEYKDEVSKNSIWGDLEADRLTAGANQKRRNKIHAV